jgi:hypothetical protein
MQLEAKLPQKTLVKDKKQTAYICLTVTPEKDPNYNRTPIGVMAVIDRSGSMEGKPIKEAKDSVKKLVSYLSDDDMFGLLIFGDDVDNIVEFDKIISKDAIYRKIDSIFAGGSTDMGSAITLGYDILNNKQFDGVKRMLVLSDGYANVGLTGNALKSRVEELVKTNDNIGITTFGLGLRYDEILLSDIAKLGNGSYYYVKTPDEISYCFSEEFGDLLSVALMKSKISCSFVNGVTVKQIYSTNEDKGAYLVGNIYSGEKRNFVIEIEVDYDKVKITSSESEDSLVKIMNSVFTSAVNRPINIGRINVFGELPNGENQEFLTDVAFSFGDEKDAENSIDKDVAVIVDIIRKAFYIDYVKTNADAGIKINSMAIQDIEASFFTNVGDYTNTLAGDNEWMKTVIDLDLNQYVVGANNNNTRMMYSMSGDVLRGRLKKANQTWQKQ